MYKILKSSTVNKLNETTKKANELINDLNIENADLKNSNLSIKRTAGSFELLLQKEKEKVVELRLSIYDLKKSESEHNTTLQIAKDKIKSLSKENEIISSNLKGLSKQNEIISSSLKDLDKKHFELNEKYLESKSKNDEFLTFLNITNKLKIQIDEALKILKYKKTGRVSQQSVNASKVLNLALNDLSNILLKNESIKTIEVEK